MKANLIGRVGVSVMFSALALLLFSPRLLSNTDTNDANNVVLQDNILQDSTIVIVGKVIDLDHQPLEGVVVRDNSTTIEQLTDEEGKFELSLDTATVVSFTKSGFYNVDHKISESDSSLVVILTPDSNEMIVKGYDSPAEKSDKTEWFDADIDTTSTLKMKYETLKDCLDNKSIETDEWTGKMDTTHMKRDYQMHMEMNKDRWNKDLKHDMDTTKTHKQFHYNENDSTMKLNNNMLEKQ
ncbi:MAG: hypothetical protein GX921_08445 [Bacteroidales bacterium]|nr:hypothetical protein [Bacteroidales bacterium]